VDRKGWRKRWKWLEVVEEDLQVVRCCWNVVVAASNFADDDE
jgi:hypothetical protein